MIQEEMHSYIPMPTLEYRGYFPNNAGGSTHPCAQPQTPLPGSKAATSGGSSWGRSETRLSSGGGGCSML